MGETTGIAWTDHTFNPWWGCMKVSPGCTNCYAEAWDKRTGGKHWGPDSERRLFGAKHWGEPRKWNRAAMAAGRPARVFCASMADVFEDHPAVVATRSMLWALIRETGWLRWQLLTKRPENIRRFLPEDWGGGYANVWLGTTAEDRTRWVERVHALQSVPARVRFVSVEPQLEEIAPFDHDLLGIHWVICGGESHQSPEKARTFRESWARLLARICAKNGTRFFMKQMGSKWATARATRLGLRWSASSGYAYDPKGGNPAEWAEDLRRQEFPSEEVPF